MPTTTYECCTHIPIPIPTRSRKNKDTHPQLTPPLPHPTHSAFPLFTIMYNKYIWDSQELFWSQGTPSWRFGHLSRSLPGGSAPALGSRTAPTDSGMVSSSELRIRGISRAGVSQNPAEG